MKTILPSDIWIADLLFLRSNRSLIYTENGGLLITVKPLELNQFYEQLCGYFGWLLIYLAAIIANFLLLILSLFGKRQIRHKNKSQFLIGNLAVCNICLALGLFVYTFLIDVYYHVDSFDTLLLINGGQASSKLPRFAKEIWIVAKFLFHTEFVEQFFTVQQLIILLAAIYSYFTIFFNCNNNYYYFSNYYASFNIVAVVAPYLFSFVLLDKNILQQWFCLTKSAANVVRWVGENF
uniref:Uncharacterized protein n=1 Tax=Meloidogyne enterolobii TaxID=390850 RepID=A0A6V7VJA1_MELEN|nr:unnamed protein product [Meloidogyne enterolobii]